MHRNVSFSHGRHYPERRPRSYVRALLFGLLIGLMVGTLAETAQAQIVINGVGSSSGRQFAGQIPITMCKSTPTPIHLQNGPFDPSNLNTMSDRHTWICHVDDQPVVIRYSASESGEGFTKLSPGATAPYILDLDGGMCNPIPQTKTISGLTFREYEKCEQQSIQPVHFGASDVEASSFGQTGPTGMSFPPPSPQALIGDVAVVPFVLFVNDGVRLRNPNGTMGGVLENLSRPQIEMLFRRNARNWDSLGYLVTDPARPGITLCLRQAGSGAKAAFDQTKLVQTGEVVLGNGVPNGTGGSIQYFPTSTDVVNCIAGNVNAIGYLNADSVVPNAHPIEINGYSANHLFDPSNTSLIQRKRDVACGRYQFWTKWRIYESTTTANTAAQTLLIKQFVEAGKINTNALPSGAFWVAESEMKVDKSLDAGPIGLIGGLTPPDNLDCRP